MSRLPAANPRPPDEINNPGGSGLGEFARLSIVLVAIVVVATALLFWLADRLAPHVPFEWEQSIADRVDLPAAHPEAQRALQALAGRLTDDARLPESMNIRVYLNDAEAPNAFATLGGRVVVTRGLVERLSSENALAFVLAHEIAHIAHRDPIRQLGRQALFQLAWSALVGGDGGGAQAVLGQAGLLTSLSYTRDMERAADRAAVATLQRHYGHLAGAGEFFRDLLEQHDESEWQELFRSHPLGSERLDYIESMRETATNAVPQPRPLPEPLSELGEGNRE